MGNPGNDTKAVTTSPDRIRRRLVAGSALAGPLIVTLHPHAAWAVSSCGQVIAGEFGDDDDPRTGRMRRALRRVGHDVPGRGINESCLVSAGLGGDDDDYDDDDDDDDDD